MVRTRSIATVVVALAVAVVAPVHRGTVRPYEQLRTDAAAREKYDDCLLMAHLTHAAPAAATACAHGLGFAAPPSPAIEASCPVYRRPTTVGPGRAGGRTWQWSVVAAVDLFGYCTRTTVGDVPPGTLLLPPTTRGWSAQPLYAAGPGSQWVLVTSEVPLSVVRVAIAAESTVTARAVAVPDYDRGRFYAVVVRLDTGRRLRVDETLYDALGRPVGPTHPHFFRLDPGPSPGP